MSASAHAGNALDGTFPPPLPSQQASYPKETYISVLAAACILTSLALRFGFHSAAIAWEVPLLLTILAGGIPLLIDLGRNVLTGQFGSDLLHIGKRSDVLVTIPCFRHANTSRLKFIDLVLWLETPRSESAHQSVRVRLP